MNAGVPGAEIQQKAGITTKTGKKVNVTKSYKVLGMWSMSLVVAVLTYVLQFS